MKEKKNSENNVPYLPVFMCLGLSVGVALGTAMDNLAMWMCFGLSIGVAVGTAMDQKKKKESEEKEQET